MSKRTDSIADAPGIAVATCWEQWLGLFSERQVPDSRQRAAVDPEALVLASLALRTRERRLDDMLLAMATESRLLSVQRIKTLGRLFPQRVTDDLAWFAVAAKRAGDARWGALAAATASEPRGRPGKSMPALWLHSRTAFMLRMRLGLGVGIKADLIACLGGLASVGNRHAGGATVTDLQRVLSYSKPATRTALDDMVRANIVLRTDGRPAHYRLAKLFFQDMERVRGGRAVAMEPPPWGYSAQLLAVLVGCGDVLDAHDASTVPDVVTASRLRDLHDRFDYCWEWYGAELVDARTHPGERFLDGFRLSMTKLFDWARQRL
jgi:hypothetical protein